MAMVWFFCPAMVFAVIVASGSESKIKLSSQSSSLTFNAALDNFSGSIVDRVAGLKGKAIGFADGNVESGLFSGAIHGAFDPANPGALTLDGGKGFWGKIGTKVASLAIAGADNHLGGWVEFDTPIQLKDASSVLFLGLSNNLTKSICLNGGLLRLFASLECNTGCILQGSGTVDLSEHAISLRPAGVPFAGDLRWAGGGQIVLHEKVQVSGNWTFDAQSKAATKIVGRGQVLDLSLGGILTIKAGSCLIFDSVVLQGLSTKSFVFEDESAQVVFVNCSLGLREDCQVSSGVCVFSGGDSLVVTGTYSLSFVGTSRLVVDGISLYYDPQFSLHTRGINVASPASIIELNGGRVVSVRERDVAPSLLVDDAQTLCFGRKDLTVMNPLMIRGLNSDVLTVVGSDLVLRCAHDALGLSQPLIVIREKKQVTFSSLVVNDFDPKCVQYGEGSDVFWGDGAQLFVARPIAFDRPFNVTGDAILRGCGDVVDISKASIHVAKNSTLVLQDLVLRGLGNMAGLLVLEDATASIVFKNVTVVLNDDYSLPEGKLLFQGTGSTIVTGSSILTIGANAQCVFDGVSVVYDPLSYPDMHNVQSALGDISNMIFKNDATLSIVNEGRVSGVLKIASADYLLQRDESLSFDRPMEICCEGLACTVDGQGYAVSFPSSPAPVFFVDEGKHVILKNMVLRDFMGSHVLLQSGAVVELGDGVHVAASQDLRFSSNISISGNVSIDCGGNKIFFERGFGFVFEQNGSLELRNGTIEDLSDVHTIFAMQKDSKLQLQDMSCILSSDFTFANGSLVVGGGCFIATRHHSFNYTSCDPLVIKSMSTMTFDQASLLRLDVPANGRGIVFADSSACLRLVDTDLSVGINGLVFDQGKMQVDGNCSVCGGYQLEGKGICFKEQSFDVQVSLKASLDLQGFVVYE